MGKRAGGRDFAPRVRSAFDRAIKIAIERDNLEEAIRQQLRDDPLGALQKMAAYAPKQINADVHNTFSIEDFVVGTVSQQVTLIEHDSAAEDNLH